MNNHLYRSCKGIVIAILLVCVILPLCNLFRSIHIEDIVAVLGSPHFLTMLKNSLIATLIATLLSVGFAFLLASCVNRTCMKGKSLFRILFTLPMLIPSISHGMGLVLLLGTNGILTNLLGLSFELYGFNGIILGSILYSFPVAFLLLNDGFQYEDAAAYEAAEVLGLNKWEQFIQITLSNMKAPIISSLFAVFTMIFTDYGVPLAVGGQVLTLPVYMYREVIGLMNYSQGAIIGVVLLVPALIEFIMDLKSGDHSVTLQGTRLTIKAHKSKDLMAFYFCSLIVLLLLLPLGTFMVLSFVESYPIDLSFSLVNIQEAFRLGVGMYLKHSIAIAFATAIVGMGITYFTAYITARSKRTFTNLSLHLISLISLAIPGVVLGLCYVLLFHGSFLYGSVFILIQVNITHFFASPYLMAYNSLKRFNANFEDVAAVHGISKMQLLFDVFVPCTKETLLEIFAYLFVNAMVTISAVSFLANFKNMPLSLLIPQFDSQSMIEATAFISIVIFGVNVMVKGIIYGLKKYSGGNE